MSPNCSTKRIMSLPVVRRCESLAEVAEHRTEEPHSGGWQTACRWRSGLEESGLAVSLYKDIVDNKTHQQQKELREVM